MIKQKTKLPNPVTGPKINILNIFKDRDGTYLGFGADIDDRQFRGDLEVRHIAGGKGIALKYKAVGMEGSEMNNSSHLYNEETILYNEEYSTIAYDTKNHLCLWALSTNIPTMVKFNLRHYREVSQNQFVLIFGFGDKEDSTTFREEITIELTGDSEITYNYSWGQPDGTSLAGSSVTMKKVL